MGGVCCPICSRRKCRFMKLVEKGNKVIDKSLDLKDLLET
jgi:hypothetical protein